MPLRDVPLKLDPETIAKVAALREALQARTPAGEVTQAYVLRFAIEKGVAVLEVELTAAGYPPRGG
jgi:hypothetical protein